VEVQRGLRAAAAAFDVRDKRQEEIGLNSVLCPFLFAQRGKMSNAGSWMGLKKQSRLKPYGPLALLLLHLALGFWRSWLLFKYGSGVPFCAFLF
jgi:hypothetical protein